MLFKIWIFLHLTIFNGLILNVTTTTPAGRGNLCPSNWKECGELCKKQGRRGGYCAGLWSERCTCVVRRNLYGGLALASDVLPRWG